MALKVSGSVILSLLLTASPFIAKAEAPNCESSNYSKDLPKPYDQGPESWCYAFTAADLLTQKLKGQVIAPLSVVNDFLKEKSNLKKQSFDSAKAEGQKESDLRKLYHDYQDSLVDDVKGTLYSEGGGSIEDALSTAKKHGVCLNSEVPSENGIQSKIGKEAKAAAAQKLKTTSFDPNSSPVFKNYKDCSLYGTGEPGVGVPVADFREDPIDEIKASKHLALYAASQAAWEEAIAKRCKTYVDVSSVSIKHEDFSKETISDGKAEKTPEQRARTLAFIDQGLHAGRIVGIGYNVGPFRGKKEAEQHASSIVGRTCDAKCNCNYLLRNSYGTNPCHVKGGYGGPYAKRCNPDGTIWITPAEVQDYVSDGTYLE